MQQENDYIKKEVEKIIFFLKKLIGKLFSVEEISSDTINEINQEFEKYFNISVFNALSLNEDTFMTNFEKFDSSILEKLVKLFLEIKKKNIVNISKSQINQKVILLLDLIDKKDKTFSFERMKLRKELK